MRLIITGFKDHGKDTASTLFEQMYGAKVANSSMIACIEFIYDKLKDKYGYTSIAKCHADRINHRAEWYDMICEYNTPDKTSLAKLIFAENNIYNGIRCIKELNAIKAAGMVDHVIWVDAFDRLGTIEESDSMTVSKLDADLILDNTGTKYDLEVNIIKLMKLID